jgi:hypothetical protein
VPFKANADRRHHIPKQRHRVTNWSEYDAALHRSHRLALRHPSGAVSSGDAVVQPARGRCARAGGRGDPVDGGRPRRAAVLSPECAIYEACLLRFRPILMTTMAALLGGVPLMLGTGAGSELRQPLGYATVGGLALSSSGFGDDSDLV